MLHHGARLRAAAGRLQADRAHDRSGCDARARWDTGLQDQSFGSDAAGAGAGNQRGEVREPRTRCRAQLPGLQSAEGGDHSRCKAQLSRSKKWPARSMKVGLISLAVALACVIGVTSSAAIQPGVNLVSLSAARLPIE